jgi:glycosyltransferase involved in cell wall biosynthesis
MRLAFYAPMKPPDHPTPSGDRRMARLLLEALARRGHEMEIACRLVSREPKGDPARQQRLIALGERLAQALLRRYRKRPQAERPEAWFTYHLYYKAPDLIGPQVAEGLCIPYLAAEVSRADKRAGGPWSAYHEALLRALDSAAAVVTINPADAPALPSRLRQLSLPPFLESAGYRGIPKDRVRLAQGLGFPPDDPWLLAVGMFREGDKLASYRLLAEALAKLLDRPWRLLVVGDGQARAAVEEALRPLGQERLAFLGALDAEGLKRCYAACDLLVWPALREAYGMALLEAQAAGLPVVAGREGGVPAVVSDGESGLLCEPGDAEAFAQAVAALLADPARRQAMGRAAQTRVAASQDIDLAAEKLDALLREVWP